jgi:hypothetical protein
MGTLGLGLDGSETRRRLEDLWAEAGLGSADLEGLRQALAEDGDLARREALIRRTRLCIRRAGFDPDLLSTPAAGMRGI